MPRYQPIFYDRCVVGASGTRLPYFEGEIRVSPVGSLPGLTRLCLHGAPELGCLTRQSVSNGRGDAGAREAARPARQLYFPQLSQLLRHILLIFPFFIILTD